MEKPQLQSEVAKKYQVLEGHGIGEYHWSGHQVNLANVDIETADRLVGLGFPYLVANKESKKAAAANNPA